MELLLSCEAIYGLAFSSGNHLLVSFGRVFWVKLYCYTFSSFSQNSAQDPPTRYDDIIHKVLIFFIHRKLSQGSARRIISLLDVVLSQENGIPAPRGCYGRKQRELERGGRGIGTCPRIYRPYYVQSIQGLSLEVAYFTRAFILLLPATTADFKVAP